MFPKFESIWCLPIQFIFTQNTTYAQVIFLCMSPFMLTNIVHVCFLHAFFGQTEKQTRKILIFLHIYLRHFIVTILKCVCFCAGRGVHLEVTIYFSKTIHIYFLSHTHTYYQYIFFYFHQDFNDVCCERELRNKEGDNIGLCAWRG